MLLYSLLHLTGYDVSLEDLKSFRQWGSQTPGPPGVRPDARRRGDDRAARPGLRERGRHGHRRAPPRRRVQPPRPRHRRPPDLRHRSDGDLQEGIASEAAQPGRPPPARQAHRPLRRQPHPARRPDGDGLVARTCSRASRPTAGTPSGSTDGNDVAAIEAAIAAARGRRPAEPDRRPDAHRLRQPEQAGHARRRTARRSGPDEVRLTKEAYGWDPDTHVLRPGRGARRCFRAAVADGRGARRRLGGALRRATRRATRPRPPSSAAGSPGELRRRLGRRPQDLRDRLARSRPATPARTRSRPWPAACPELFGGSADLSESNLTDVKGEPNFSADEAGRNLRFGVREHAMGGIANGIAYHGGFIPYVAHVPHLQRLHARLGAARGARRAARRSTSGPTTPSASARTARRTSRSSTTPRCGRSRTCGSSGPATPTRRPRPGRSRSSAATARSALALTRQKLPTLPGTRGAGPRGRRPRRLRPARGDAAATPAADPDRDRLGAAARLRRRRGARGRRHPDPRRVAPLLGAVRGPGRRPTATPSCRRPSASASASRSACSLGWERWVGDEGAIIGLDHFGASAPAGTIFEQFGFTADRVADVGRRVVRDGLRGRVPTARTPGTAGRTRPRPETDDADAHRVRRRPRRGRAQGRAARRAWRRRLGHELIDLGGDGSRPGRTTTRTSPSGSGRPIRGGEADRGILICGSRRRAPASPRTRCRGIRAGRLPRHVLRRTRASSTTT